MVLERLISALSSGLILENLHHEFVRCLKEGTEAMQTLCLSQLQRVSQDIPEVLSQSRELLDSVAAQLANDSQAVARLATNVLVNLGHSPQSVEMIYSGDVFETLQTVMSVNETMQYRVFQLAVEVSSLSAEALELSKRSGLLTKLVNEIHKDDILLQLNCLELLSELALTNQGMHFLDQEGVIRKLDDMMSTAGASALGAFLLPGLMKFFGGLARFHPKEVLNHFHTFMGVVFTSISERGDPSIKGLAIDTIGFIGSTPEGKSALSKQGNAMTECLNNLGNVIKNSPNELRSRALVSVASLLRIEVSEQTEELLQITQNWFSRLCSNPFDVVWSVAKQPFFDLRISAIRVLQSLALLPWGQQLMNNTAGFKEYLLDRAIETTKESKEAKFEVVKILAESPTMVDTFGRPYYVQLIDFYRQGPFYVLAQSEVAFEEM